METRVVVQAALVTALVGIAVYLNTLDNGLTYDDPRILETAAGLGDAGVPTELRGRALTLASHALDTWLWRGSLAGRRLTNLALYGIVVALVTWVTLRWTHALRPALLTGLVFAVHPVHVEAVAALGFRKDLLALLFVVLTVLFWHRAERGWIRITGAGLCLVAGLLSKEAAVIGVVPFLLVADLARAETHGDAGRRVGRALRRLAPLIVIAVAGVAILGTSLHSPTGSGGVLARFQAEGIRSITEGRLASWGDVLVTLAASFPDVLRLLFLPHRLSIEYPLDPPSLVQAQAVLGAFLFLVVTALTIVALRRRWTVPGLALAWILLLYLPVSNLVPLTHFFLADRYLFTPSFGACLLLGLGLERLWSWTDGRAVLARALPLGVTAVVLVMGAVHTIDRNRDWRDDLSLWTAALRSGATTYRAYNNVGALLLERGQVAQAEQSFRNALKIYPLAPDPHRSLAMILLQQERWDEAISHMQAALREAPEDIVLRLKLAETLQRQGHGAEALQEYDRALHHLGEAQRRGIPTTVSEQTLRTRIQQLRDTRD